MKLSELGEDRLLEQLLPLLPAGKDVVAAVGDDCAVIAPRERRALLLLKTDCVVEGVHYEKKADPAAVGWKAMMRPLSDFAAMSGRPEFALVTVILRKETTVAWVKKLYGGLTRAATKFGVTIVGGETSSTRGPTAVSVYVSGSVEKERLVRRSGGKKGDALFVTGRLGGSIRGKHLNFVPRIVESRWLTRHFSVHAMMDISDGLGVDLPRLALASKLGYSIDREKLPLNPGCTIENALSDGEDYELLFAAAPRQGKELEKRWRKKFPKLALTRIGRLNPKFKIRNSKLQSGYVHFQ